MTVEETADFLAMVSDLYPSSTFSDTALESWSRALQPFPAEAVNRVFWLIAEPRFPPTAVAIVQELVRLSQPEAVDVGAAWAMINKAGLRCSPTDATCAREFVNHEPTWKALEWIGGWTRFALADIKEHNTMLAHFRRAYEGVQDAERDEERRALIGITPGEITPFALEEGDDDD